MKKLLILFILFSICFVCSCRKEDVGNLLDNEKIMTDEMKNDNKASSDGSEIKQSEEKEINIKYCLLDREASFKLSNLNIKIPRYIYVNEYVINFNDNDYSIKEALVEGTWYLDKEFTIPYDKNKIPNDDFTLYMEEENVLSCLRNEVTDQGEYDEEKGHYVNDVYEKRKPFLNGIASSKNGKVVLDESEIEYLDIENNEFIEAPLMIKYRSLLYLYELGTGVEGIITPFGSERSIFNNPNIKEIEINTDLLYNKVFDYSAAIVSYPGLERIVVNGDLNEITDTIIKHNKNLREIVFNGSILKTTENGINLYNSTKDIFVTVRFNGEINNLVDDFIVGEPDNYEVIYKNK